MSAGVRLEIGEEGGDEAGGLQDVITAQFPQQRKGVGALLQELL